MPDTGPRMEDATPIARLVRPGGGDFLLRSDAAVTDVTELRGVTDGAAGAAAAAAAGADAAASAAAAATGELVPLNPEPVAETAAAAAAAVAVGAEAAASAAAAADDEQLRKQYEVAFISLLNDLTAKALPPTIGKFRSRIPGQPGALARLIMLSRKLSDVGANYALYRQAYYAAVMLRATPDNGQAVIDVIDDVEFTTSRNSPLYFVMKGLGVALIYELLLGALLLGVFALPNVVSSLLAYESSAGEITTDAVYMYFELWTSPLVISVVFGILGSVVSILLRLQEFESAGRKSRQFLTMTGAFLPLVGGIFAAVTFALFGSGLINFQFANATGDGTLEIASPYFYMVVGFLSGFSERFTRGLLGKAETAVSGPRDLAVSPSVTKH